MSTTRTPLPAGESSVDYSEDRSGLRQYLRDLADELFPFPGYRDHQQEILNESLESLFIDGFDNVIIDGPVGIGKSPINVTIGRVVHHLAMNKEEVESYFSYPLHGIQNGKSFYTTPQKQLRNQLAEDEDLKEYLQMLKSRQDYICGVSGDNCKECSAPSGEDDDVTCRTMPGCTYWGAKTEAMQADIAALTFAMGVVDNYIPKETPQGERLSFGNRDLMIVDEGHNLEGQVSSLFAGFEVSPWKLPDKVYKGVDAKIRWNYERFEDVESILDELQGRAESFIERWEDTEQNEIGVEQCENFVRKTNFCREEVQNGRPWTVTVSKLADTGNKKMKLSPVDVDNFLQKFIWSRGSKRVISSATIPYRRNIEKWADRLGLDGSTKLVSKPMPFPEENRLVHKNTIVGSMSGDGEDRNWSEVVDTVQEIHSHHDGENGLIHTTSYKRAEKLADDLGRENVIVQDSDKDKSLVIQDWQQSEKDILLSPSMMEGVDLHDDLCRWQVLVKVPYAYVGDSRVSYLLNERNDWEWYNETAMMDVMQSVGRAVRGPDDYASYYVLDQAFEKLMAKVDTPDWFDSAVREHEPKSWGNASLGDYQ